MAYVARRQLNIGTSIVQPGDPYPAALVRPSLLALGWVEEVPGVQQTDSGGAELVHVGGGWYDVVVDGAPVNETRLRKADAEALVR